MIDVAIEAATKGGQHALSYFTKIKNVSYKSDNSPVTIADKNTEKLIRKIIQKNFFGYLHGVAALNIFFEENGYIQNS